MPLILLLLLLFALPASAYQVSIGSYVVGGSASDNRDIVISPAFQPDVVIIKCDAASGEVVFKTSAMDALDTAILSGTGAETTNRIQALNADGFQVGTSDRVQPVNSTCYYTAFANDANNDLAVGLYTGNDAEGRDIVISPAFSPQMVWIKATVGVSQSGVWRTTAHTGDDSSRFANVVNAANMIQAFNADGFELGTDGAVNSGLGTYAYVAFKAVPGYNDTGTFTGNATDDRDIASIDTPTFIFTKANSTAIACGRWGTAGDSSGTYAAGVLAANQVQALTATGFQVGTAACVNSDTNAVYWWLTKTPVYAAARQRARHIIFQ